MAASLTAVSVYIIPFAVQAGLSVPVGRTATVSFALTALARGTFTVPVSVTADAPDPDPASNASQVTLSVAGAPRLRLVRREPTRRNRAAVIASARVSIDEAAALKLEARSPSGKPIALLAGSSLAGGRLARRKLVFRGRAGAAGAFTLQARLPARGLRGRGRYVLVLAAIDADGLSSSVTISLLPPAES